MRTWQRSGYGGMLVKQNVYTVAQINSYIKNMFTQDYMLRSVLVKGEGISILR